MTLKTMNPGTVWELINEVEDVITPAVAQEDAVFKTTSCPICGSQDIQKRIDAPKVVLGPDGDPVVAVSPFGRGPLPRSYASCTVCGTEFDPRTGIIRHGAPVMIRGPHEDPR